MDHFIARQMLGQGQTAGPAAWCLRLPVRQLAFDDALGMGLLGFQFFERQFQLISLARHALGRLTELHAPELDQGGLQLLDLELSQNDRVLCRRQFVARGGQLLPFGFQRLLRCRKPCLHLHGKSTQIVGIGG